MLVSCSSIGPTGNPEKDAKQFAEEMFSACKADNLDRMKEILNTYYEFYNDQNAEDISEFFSAWKDELSNFSEYGIVEDKFSEMGEKADKDGKMEELYKKSL